MANQAIGMIECKGLCALFEATDAALKAANVSFTGWEKVGSVVSVQVIPRPHDGLAVLGKWLQ